MEKFEERLNSKEFRESMKDLVAYTKRTIDGTRKDYDGELPYNNLTIGMNTEGEWSYQTGDNSFTGGAYGFPCWAVVYVHRRSKREEIISEILSQLRDCLHSTLEYERRTLKKG